MNGNRLTYILLTAVLGICGFLAVQVWILNATVSEIRANRFTSQDALDHERIETLRFDAVNERLRRLEVQVAQLPPKDFRNRVHAMELEMARRYNFKPPRNGE